MKKLANLSDDYKRFNLKETHTPEKWEDGMRSTGKKGTYEWWYFDAHLENGSILVIVFYTKDITDLNSSLSPRITVTINKPDGTKIEKDIRFNAEKFSAAKDTCDVKIDKNYFTGNLEEYEIHVEDKDFNLTAKIKRTAESWRPKTGHMTFGPEGEKLFNWVVAIPQGRIELSYIYNNESISTSGSCYHDHNWGNISMSKLFNNWYWARAEVGPYNIIASEMISEKKFNNDNIVVFNISKNGKTIADNGEQVKLYRTYGKMHPTLNKDISDDLIFIYNNPEDEYRYELYLFKEKIIEEWDILEDSLGGKGLAYIAAKAITGFDGAYFRFAGKSEVKVFKADKLIEKHSSSTAVWELMYFGKPHGM